MANSEHVQAVGGQGWNNLDDEIAAAGLAREAEEFPALNRSIANDGRDNPPVNTARRHTIVSTNNSNVSNGMVSSFSNAGWNMPPSNIVPIVQPFVGNQHTFSRDNNVVPGAGHSYNFSAGSHSTVFYHGLTSASSIHSFPRITSNPSSLRAGHGPFSVGIVNSYGAPLGQTRHQHHQYIYQQRIANLPSGTTGGVEEEQVVEEESEEDQTSTNVTTSQSRGQASRRQSRSRWWPRRSDQHRVYPSFWQRQRELRNSIIELGTGEDSGRNRLAIFEGAGEIPRLAYNIRLAGRGSGHWQGYYSPRDVYLPMGLTLEDMLAHFPNHVWNDGIRLFMAEGWQAEAMWRGLPSDARNSGASTRPWNYLQQALGREADKIAKEVTGRKRVPEKRPRRDEYEEDEDEEEQEGDDE